MNQPMKDDIKFWIIVILCIGTCGIAVPFILMFMLLFPDFFG